MFVTSGHLLRQAASPHRSTNAKVATRLLPSTSRTRKTAPSILNTVRTLSPASNPQPFRFHTPAHRFTSHERVTRAFSITSALLARSFANVQVSTPLFSCAHALFVKNTREGVYPRSFAPCFQQLAHSQITMSEQRALPTARKRLIKCSAADFSAAAFSGRRPLFKLSVPVLPLRDVPREARRSPRSGAGNRDHHHRCRHHIRYAARHTVHGHARCAAKTVVTTAAER